MGVEDKPGTEVGKAARHGGSLHRRYDSVITKEELYRARRVGSKTVSPDQEEPSRGRAVVSLSSSSDRVASLARIVLTCPIVFCRAASKDAIRLST